MPIIVLDTGPLVALLDRNDRYHLWAVEQFKAFPPPFLTCDAVITEASHILHRNGFNPDKVFSVVVRDAVRLQFDLDAEAERVQGLMRRYRDTPMDLADACLVRMAELHPNSQVLTLDSDLPRLS